MPISKDFNSIHQETFIIDYFDCDTNGKLKLVDLCKLLQLVSSNHSVLGGISLWDLEKHNQAWVLNKFRLEIDYMPSWQQTITISTWIEKLDGVRSIRNFQVLMDNKPIIGASSLWVIINTQTRRPQGLTIDHQHFTKYEQKKVFKSAFTNFSKQLELQFLANDVVRYSDLDMLKHVTNIKYIEWVIDAIHQNDLPLENIRILDMVFQKELIFKEPYTISRNISQHQNHYIIQDDNQKVNFQCILESKLD
ncbi:acyl-[acyl-carrier-protein] thioesterase [Myroides sp. LJL119]